MASYDGPSATGLSHSSHLGRSFTFGAIYGSISEVSFRNVEAPIFVCSSATVKHSINEIEGRPFS